MQQARTPGNPTIMHRTPPQRQLWANGLLARDVDERFELVNGLAAALPREHEVVVHLLVPVGHLQAALLYQVPLLRPLSSPPVASVGELKRRCDFSSCALQPPL